MTVVVFWPFRMLELKKKIVITTSVWKWNKNSVENKRSREIDGITGVGRFGMVSFSFYFARLRCLSLRVRNTSVRSNQSQWLDLGILVGSSLASSYDYDNLDISCFTRSDCKLRSRIKCYRYSAFDSVRVNFT